jgi:hypothetical protein
VKKILLTLFLMLTMVNLAGAVDFQFKKYYSFNGGLNDSMSNSLIGDNEASDLLNITFDEEGAIKKRTGQVCFSTNTVNVGAEIKGIYDYIKRDGTQYLIAASSSTIKKYNSSTLDWDTLCSTATAVSTDYYDFDVFMDTCIIVNGKDIPKKWYGTGNTENIGTGTDPDDWRPNTAATVAVWDYRLWFGNITDANAGSTDSVTPNRLRYSSDLGTVAFENADAWPPLNYFDMDDEKIVGLATCGARLLVFCPNKIYAIAGNSNSTTISYYRVLLNDGVGCASNRSIVTSNGKVYWISRTGNIYVTDGSTITEISKKISTTINGLNKSRLPYSCAGKLEKYGQIWFSVDDGSGTTNDTILVYTEDLGAWSIYTGINASAMAERKVSGDYQLYTGDVAAGLIYRQDYGYSDYIASTTTASGIDAYYITKSFGVDYEAFTKTFDAAYVKSNYPGTYLLKVFTYLDDGMQINTDTLDLNPHVATWGSFVWGDGSIYTASTKIGIAELPIEKDGNFIKFKFQNSTVNQSFTIYGLTLKYNVRPLY